MISGRARSSIRIPIALGCLVLLAALVLLPLGSMPASAGPPDIQLRQEDVTPPPPPDPTEFSTQDATPTSENVQDSDSLAQPQVWGQALVSDGQFVWGPNVGDFDVTSFLSERASPLSAYANIVEVNAAYASINPQVLLAVLEVRYGLVSAIPQSMDEASLTALIEDTSMGLHKAFYEHLYQWGSRARQADQQLQPSIALADGASLQVAAGTSSGSYAVASALGGELTTTSAETLIAADTQGGFGSVFASFFPDVDPLDLSNDINPDAPPPADLLQFPFPLNAAWRFSGAHSWAGADYGPDRSSMDFSVYWPEYPDFPYRNTVASASGSALIRTPYAGRLPCWVEVDHGGGWMTSYYHLRNIGSSSGPVGTLNRNQLIGTIGTEICNGGFATGAHVHFTLLFNGALVDLDGIKLSGWAVHVDWSAVGNDTYSSGYIERDGVIKTPYNTVLNDYNTYYGSGLDYSLRFFGNGSGDIDRVKIPLGDFDPNLNTGPMTDIGIFDFTVEWWLKTGPGGNDTPGITCGANDNWKDGNLLFDSSRGTGTNEWGVSIAGGRIAFGVSGSGGQKYTVCSVVAVDDGNWHHILIQRNRYDSTHGYLDGQLWLFVDGVLQVTAVGPGGDISYPDGAIPGSTCGVSGTQPCSDDPYLVIGASKYDVGEAFDGTIDDLRFAGQIRYPQGNFSPPTQPLTSDGMTVALFNFNEGSGNVLFDTAGYDNGASTATRFYGGSPAGPVWTTVLPFVQYQYIFLPLIVR